MADPENPIADVAKILSSEPVNNLLVPVTKEIGEFLGTIANLARFYATRNLAAIFRKWAQSRPGRPLTAEEFERAMPLLPAASLVSDDELQKRWARLMESAATETRYLPSFGQTLAQLTSEEAQYLDRLWKIASQPSDYLSSSRPGRMPLPLLTFIAAFDSSINTGINPAEYQLFKNDLSPEQRANYERYDQAQLVIDDLTRLGIVAVEQQVEPERWAQFGDRKIPVMGSPVSLTSTFSFSEYGVSFMRAVAKRGDRDETEPSSKAEGHGS